MERKALGRGIASLVPSKPDVPAASSPVTASNDSLPVQQIRVNPYQPRQEFEQPQLEELAQSIKTHGILCPLIVARRDGHFELISGERRLRAATLAGLSEVPVVVRETEPSQQLELALIENIQREDLSPIEEGNGYQMLLDQFNYTQEQVAQRVGKDRTTVANLLRLLKLPTRVKQALQAGQISAGHARALAGVPEIERQLYFCEQVIAEGWSVRELETRIAARRVIGLKAKMKDLRPLPQYLVQILDELRRRLGTQIRLIPQGKKGKILIEYYSDEDLDRIYRVLMNG